jgi:predicted nucleic acid-binding protein
MRVYLDSVIVIYFVEGPAPFQTRAQAHLTRLRATGDQPVISDLVRLECWVKPFRLKDAALRADYDKFFAAADVIHAPLHSPAYERAAQIRADWKFRLGDSLNLAAAVEAKCDRFLTNDHRLKAFPDIAVEVLP